MPKKKYVSEILTFACTDEDMGIFVRMHGRTHIYAGYFHFMILLINASPSYYMHTHTYSLTYTSHTNDHRITISSIGLTNII
jgi:hypothetical protein